MDQTSISCNAEYLLYPFTSLLLAQASLQSVGSSLELSTSNELDFNFLHIFITLA